MQMRVKTPVGTISASYLHDKDGNTGIHAGFLGSESVVSLEYSNKYGGIVLIINHDALDASGVKLVSVVGGWNELDKTDIL